jgi:hypothetical protein
LASSKNGPANQKRVMEGLLVGGIKCIDGSDDRHHEQLRCSYKRVAAALRSSCAAKLLRSEAAQIPIQGMAAEQQCCEAALVRSTITAEQ